MSRLTKTMAKAAKVWEPGSPLVPTIIITHDPSASLRGYSLLGREFVLKYPFPKQDEMIMLDGVRVVDFVWMVEKEEYMRVVPEARQSDFEGDVISFPQFVAKRSLRPVYVK